MWVRVRGIEGKKGKKGNGDIEGEKGEKEMESKTMYIPAGMAGGVAR